MTKLVGRDDSDQLRSPSMRLVEQLLGFPRQDRPEADGDGSAHLTAEIGTDRILDALPAAVYTTDAAGRITFYNEAASIMWGCRPELGESEYCGSWKLFWPDRTPLPHHECPMAVALREGRPIRGVEGIAERPDGTRVPFMAFPTPLFDEQGVLIGAINMLVDITERKQAEQRVRDSEQRFRGIFDSARVSVWYEDFSSVIDMLAELRAEGVGDLRAYFRDHPERLAEAVARVRIDDVNSFTLELLEADRKECLLGSLNSIFLPETTQVFVEELVALWEGRRRFESETVLRTLKGRRVDVTFTIAFEGDRCERTLVSIFNITARKAVERRLETLNRVAKTISSNLDLETLVQSVTDVGTELSGAKFGAFFYNVADSGGERYTLDTLSGAARSAFEQFGLDRNTAVFEPTFRGTGVVRSDDIRRDPRYAPHFGMPAGHLPVVSYLAVPVASRSGEVHGGLFFAHPEAGAFTQDVEDLVTGIAAQAATAIDNANLLRAAQLEADDRRRTEETARQLASIVESSGDAIYGIDLDGSITSWNRGAAELFGYSASEVIGLPATILLPEDRFEEEATILERITHEERIENYDTVRRRKDGSLIDVSLNVSPIRNADGKIVGASKNARDASERKRAEEQQAVLLGEMKHRIKNTLATVQAIANQTLKGLTPAELAQFTARLQALDRAHELLTSRTWDKAPLGAVLNRALKPFKDTHWDRLVIEGPDVLLNAQQSVMITLAFHELATNAVKYGALSNGSGMVHVLWALETEMAPPAIQLHWRESGGPPVKSPDRKGFGSRLIEVLGRQAAGSAQLEFAPHGLICSIGLAATDLND